MASQAWKDMLSGTGNDWDGAFQYGPAIRGPRSTYETAEAYDQRNQGQQEARDIANMYYRNQQRVLNNQLTGGGAGTGGGANPFSTGGSSSSSSGGAPTLNTGNRFEAGLSDAEGRLRSLLDNPDSINQSAAYKFRVNQGQEALQRSLGAKGLLNSGNRLMELTKYGQDMGSQEYDNQFGRIKDLVGGYSGSWIGDKNANTGIFNAQANAWNTAQANADRTRLGYADIAAQNSRAAMSGGGGSSGGGTNLRNLFSSQPSAQTDPWSYNTGSYNAGTGESWYTNDQTGQQQKRYG